MKNIDKVLFLPLFAALAVGCSSPTAFQTSEYDDVYYTSKDKTIIQENPIIASTESSTEAEEVTEDGTVPNPEYSQKNSGTGYSYRDNNNSNRDNNYDRDLDYYSDDYLYSSRRYAPYRSGLSYYDLAYTDPFWFNRNSYLFGRSAFYDPFFPSYSYYDPFYNPYFDFGFRSPRIYNGLTVVLGNPYRGGWYGSPYYGGYYGGFNQGIYGGGFNRYYANSGWYRNDTNDATKVQYGRRRDRADVPTGNNSTGRATRPRGDVGGIAPGGGGGIVAPDGGRRGDRATDLGERRPTRSRGVAGDENNTGRSVTDAAEPGDAPTRTSRGRQDRSIDNSIDNQVDRAPEMERSSRRSRVEPGNYNFPDQPARTDEAQPRSRSRSERSTESYTPSQPRMERTTPREQPDYQPRRTERSRETYRSEPTYQAPRQERTYEAPRQERSYEQPSSRPSSGGGSSNDGGGRSGGRPRN